MIVVIEVFIGFWMFIAGLAVHPSSIRCPRDFYAEGVRPTGQTRCLLICDEKDTEETHVDLSFPARVYCPVGSQPIARRDGRTVSCQKLNRH